MTGFRSYVDLYVKDKLDEMGVALKVVNETVNDRWEVCLTLSEKGFQQIGFVNSIATTKVSENHRRETARRSHGRGGGAETSALSNTEGVYVSGRQTC